MKALSRKLLVAASVAAATFVAGQASAVELVHGSWPPAVVYMNRVTLPEAFKAIEEETKGEIKWKLVAGGQLANPKESFQATSDGLIQGALGISTYVPNLVPSLNTIYSTIVFEGDVQIATGAALETLYFNCPSCLAEFKKINIVPLSGWTSSQYYLACRKPVASVADVKGLRIRATGGYSELWKMAGAVPVSATLPEAVTLLQRGGLDCQNGVHSWLKTFGYGDFAKNITNHPVGLTGPAIGIMLNRDAWNAMTAEQKAIHIKWSAKISANQALGEFTLDNAKYLKDVIDNKGVKMIDADAASFVKLGEDYDEAQRVANIKAAEGFGVPNPGAIIDAYKANLAKWTKLIADAGIGSDFDKLTKLYDDEIFSKINVDDL